MSSKTNEPDADAMMRAFDAPADDWHGAGLAPLVHQPADLALGAPGRLIKKRTLP
jgi:hypothetical protein